MCVYIYICVYTRSVMKSTHTNTLQYGPVLAMRLHGNTHTELVIACLAYATLK